MIQSINILLIMNQKQLNNNQTIEQEYILNVVIGIDILHSTNDKQFNSWNWPVSFQHR